MAAGDYHIRENASNTDEIPDAGSTLDIEWDTQVATKGTTITYNSGTDEFNLVDTGKYLVMYADQNGSTSTTDNARLNTRIKAIIGGSTTDYCRSSGYNRKRNGAQEVVHVGYGIIDVASANTKLKLQYDREDNTTGASERPDRVADDSGITIVKLDDSWNYARYRLTSDAIAPDTDGSSDEIAWDVIDEEDSPFELTGGAGNSHITISTTNLCRS